MYAAEVLVGALDKASVAPVTDTIGLLVEQMAELGDNSNTGRGDRSGVR